MTITDDVRRHRLSLLPVLFAAFATFSLLLAVRTTQEPHRVWAACGLVTYSAAAVVTGVSAGTRAGRRVEPTVLWSVVLGALVVPTGILTANGRGQLEVRVVAESARRLMDEGTPYTAAPADVGDYNPYSPMMALFGMPRAWWGDGMVTDPRLWCAVALLVCMVCARVLLGTPRTPGHRLLLVAVGSPLVALTVAGSGVDLPVTGAVILALAAAVSGRPVVAGVAVGVAVAMKWTALPVAAVVVIVLWRRHSRHSRHSRRTAGTFAVVAGGLAAVAAVCGTGGDLGGFVHHTIGFPLGHGAVPTPAGESLVGGLLHGVPVLSWIPSGVLAGVAVGLLRVLTTRPPDVTTVASCTAAGYAALFLLAPSAREGYFILPLLIVAAAYAYRAPGQSRVPGRRVGAPVADSAPDQGQRIEHLHGRQQAAWDELGSREPDDVDDRRHVGDDPLHLRPGQSARYRTETEHDVVTVHHIDVEMDRHLRASCRTQPLQQRRG